MQAERNAYLWLKCQNVSGEAQKKRHVMACTKKPDSGAVEKLPRLRMEGYFIGSIPDDIVSSSVLLQSTQSLHPKYRNDLWKRLKLTLKNKRKKQQSLASWLAAGDQS